MTEQIFDRDSEWLELAPPVGLVVSRLALKEVGLLASRQTALDTAAAREHLKDNLDGAVLLRDPWSFFAQILGWRAQDVAGAPNGPAMDPELVVPLPDLATTLEPTWAVRAPKGSDAKWQLLVRIEAEGVEPDKRGALDGWEATPQQRFERLLRETRVHAGLLVTDKEIRLVYAPPGETSGWQAFPIHAFGSVPGRPILAGLKLLLERPRLFGTPTQRLPLLLKRSREAQATVSSALSSQVLGALHELNRGLLMAERHSHRALITDLARSNPHHLYEGLLTVLMRLVFVLYAEDRDLIPSKTEPEARWLYKQGYSVSGLFAKLANDEALYPDTMDERVGGWGQLLALFRLIHKGHHSGFIRARGGKLFDPDVFPFIEGRAQRSDAAIVLPVSDGCLLRILRGLMVLDGERLSYRALDVEAIGSVYETVMGFTVELTQGASIAIKAGKNNKVPVFVDLDALITLKPDARLKYLKEEASRSQLGDRQKKDVKAAKTRADLLAALESIVDERGSPERQTVPPGTPVLQPTDERRRTGSHYTPRSLTEPIVRHALEPAFARLGPEAKPEQILELKLCDPAMGSGAFLVEACRQLGARLQQAWARWPEERPQNLPKDEDEELHAKRLVAQRCLYGVDKNPMATDLAKLSLWLATLARDHEFEFLDHALRTGDSLVGLSLDQIVSTHWEADKPPTFAGRFVSAMLLRASMTRALIRDRAESATEKELRVLFDSVLMVTEGARLIGDGIIGAFFSEEKKYQRLGRLVEFQKLVLSHLGKPDWIDLAVPYARKLEQGEHPIRPFHWQLEFPEVFEGDNPGFDAIVGNPPFAGKNTIINGNRAHYVHWLQALHEGAHGNADLVAHFYRRAFNLLRNDGTFGLIATNTIGQGDTRATGLTHILANKGVISHATRRLKWPGEAAVVVSGVHVRKGMERGHHARDGDRMSPLQGEGASPLLDGRPVRRISAYLVEGDLDVSPRPLAANAGKAFQGSIVLGMGFTFDDAAAAKGTASSLVEMQRLIDKDKSNRERIFPYIGGEEVNNDPQHRHHRYVMRLEELSLEEAEETAPELLAIVRSLVKPERDKQADNADGRRRKQFWWKWGRDTPALYRAIAELSHVYCTLFTAPHLAVAKLENGAVFANTLNVFAYETKTFFALLQSRIHEVWARFFASTLEDRLRYTPSDCFATFPFPPGFETDAALEAAGEAYHAHRAQLMIARNEGLTKTYNRFHNPREDSPDIIRLRELHDAMDRAVLTAYGWTDLAEHIATDPDAMPRHLTEETEDDHKYQKRYFWPAPIRDDVLARLLALNATRAEAERLAGLAPTFADDEETGDASEDETEGEDADRTED